MSVIAQLFAFTDRNGNEICYINFRYAGVTKFMPLRQEYALNILLMSAYPAAILSQIGLVNF